MNRDKINNILDIVIKYAIVFVISAFIIIITFPHIFKDKYIDNNIQFPDTTYNKVVLDSIEYNIIKLDSTIIELNNKYKDDVKETYNLSDSASVKLFERLSMGAN